MQAAELPGLTFRPDLAVGAAANVIFANWLGFLRQEASANEPASSRK
jgi:homoserine O-succinyltransferase